MAKPQFVYLATIEPHVIYKPKKEFLVKYWDKPYTGPIKPTLTGVQLGPDQVGKLKVNDNDKAYLEALHDAEITQSDAAFGTFIADLKTLGIYDKSAVIVVSDHGDEFWEHGNVGHAQTVHQELVHIPLIIRAPGRVPAGQGRAAPTSRRWTCSRPLLELAGAASPAPTCRATAWCRWRATRWRQPARRADHRRAVARGIKVERFRLVHGGPGRMELYDELRRSARAEGRRRRAPDRAALDARRARPAVRLRERLVEAGLGHRRQPHRSVLRGGGRARPPRRRAENGRPEVARGRRRRRRAKFRSACKYGGNR